MPHVSDARDAVLPNEKSHSLVTQKLAKHIVSEGSLKPCEARLAIGVVLEAVPLVSLLVWQKVICEQDATKPPITQRHFVFIKFDTLCSIVARFDTLCTIVARFDTLCSIVARCG